MKNTPFQSGIKVILLLCSFYEGTFLIIWSYLVIFNIMIVPSFTQYGLSTLNWDTLTEQVYS